eukprot:2874648-Heterocapsa_arctica.AAC.2
MRSSCSTRPRSGSPPRALSSQTAAQRGCADFGLGGGEGRSARGTSESGGGTLGIEGSGVIGHPGDESDGVVGMSYRHPRFATGVGLGNRDSGGPMETPP